MADTDVKPAFSLVEEASGRWKIGLVNFQRFEEVLKHASTRSGGCVDIVEPRTLRECRVALDAEDARTSAGEAMMTRAERTKGFFVSFAYGAGALTEIDRFFRQTGKIIIPLTVNEILNEQIAQKSA